MTERSIPRGFAAALMRAAVKTNDRKAGRFDGCCTPPPPRTSRDGIQRRRGDTVLMTTPHEAARESVARALFDSAGGLPEWWERDGYSYRYDADAALAALKPHVAEVAEKAIAEWVDTAYRTVATSLPRGSHALRVLDELRHLHLAEPWIPANRIAASICGGGE